MIKWDVSIVDVYPRQEDYSNVVYNVHWRVTKEDGEYTSSTYGTQILSTSDIGNFVPFDELTTEIIEGWVFTAMGDEEVAKTEAYLDFLIGLQKNPISVTKKISS